MSSRSQIFSSDGFGEVVIFSLSCCHTSPVTLHQFFCHIRVL